MHKYVEIKQHIPEQQMGQKKKSREVKTWLETNAVETDQTKTYGIWQKLTAIMHMLRNKKYLK